MLSALADQENAVHARQAAAAAKPLNQGVQGLTAKTPGNRAPKTPFKAPLNNENDVVNFGKSNGKGLGGKQEGKVQKNLFQTPAPRERQALGFKTTNAKATAFQTPAPKTGGPSPEKTQRRTVGRSRLQIHKEEIEAPKVDWGNEEIQYIGPRPRDLPDVKSDDEWDKVDVLLKTKSNPTAAWAAANAEKRSRRFEAEDARLRNHEAKRLNNATEESLRSILQQLEQDSDEEVASKPPPKAAPFKKGSSVGTLTARSAASALSRPTAGPSYAAPTASAKAKAPSSDTVKRTKTPLNSAHAIPSHGRVSSHSTLGYAKGRAVSNTVRPNLSDEPQAQQKPKAKKADPLKELQDLIRAREYEELGIKEEDLEDLEDGGVSLADDDDEEDFQFTIPEDI